MADNDAFATIRRARSLLERHPDAPASAAHVALVMATFANGRTGTSIRPGLARVEELTGLDRRTVQRAVRWLEQRRELRRDKEARRGSAACFTWVGGMGRRDTALTPDGAAPARDGAAPGTTHQPNQPQPSGPPGPRDGKRAGEQPCSGCGRPLGYLLDGDGPTDGALCLRCFHGR
jgi:hypothetical protein